MNRNAAPRLYCIPATKAPVVAVFRRGPTNWSTVGRWNLRNGRHDHGAWLNGRIFPRRSDLSPDGQFLCYFAHKPGARWAHAGAYVAVSKLPWLSALHAFGTCGTRSRGYCFADGPHGDEPEQADLPIPYRMRSIPLARFANEKRRGWVEARDSPPRDPSDTWDERRDARLRKAQPGGERVLYVESTGRAGGEWAQQAVDGLRVVYALQDAGAVELLPRLQRADWDREGRLLVATRKGRLQVWQIGSDGMTTMFDHDLSALEPDCRPAPSWAQRW